MRILVGFVMGALVGSAVAAAVGLWLFQEELTDWDEIEADLPNSTIRTSQNHTVTIVDDGVPVDKA